MTTTPRSTFGALLRRHRLTAGLTQEGLAERAGLSARGIQDIERGVNLSPRAETIRMLADALDLDATDRAELIAAAHPEVISPTGPAGAPLRLPDPPAPPTALVGREDEVATASALLREPRGVRLLTLTGPGGVGKTRLALAIAADLAGEFADGVAWIDLAPVGDPGLVAGTIVQALGLHESGDQFPNQLLAAALANRCMLLILDNMEHLLPAVPLVAELLSAGPRLSVLVTSRARLRLRGERELPVLPLEVPALASGADLSQLDRLANVAAVRLFIERSAEARPEFALRSDNAAAIAEICRRLDGLPLAIELAAAWSKVLSPPALLTRLERRLPLLTSGQRDLPDRQRTMRDTIAWSHNLLTPEERALFRRLAIFSGGLTLEAAGMVSPLDDFDPRPGAQGTLGLIAALAEQNLLRPVEQPGGETRFMLMETVREYGLEQLRASGEEAALRQLHADYYLALAERAEPELTGPEQAGWLERLETEQANLRKALEWSMSPAGDIEMGLRLADALWTFWEMRGSLREGRHWLDGMLAHAPERTALRARVLTGAGALAFDQGDYIAARALHEESLTIRRELGDRRGIAVSLGNLGNVAHHQGEFAAARELHEECLAIMRALGQQGSVAIVLENLGRLALSQGDYLAAQRFHEESLAMTSELGDVWGRAIALNSLGEVALHRGDYGAARTRLDEALAIMRDLRDARSTAVVLNNVGEVALALANPAEARTLFVESLTLGRNVGDRSGIAASLTNLAVIMLDEDEPAGARPLLEESLAIRQGMHDKPGIARCLLGYARIAQAHEQPARAARLLGAVEALLGAVGAVLSPAERAAYECTADATRDALGQERYATAYAAGAAMPLQQAVAERLGLLDEPPREPGRSRHD